MVVVEHRHDCTLMILLLQELLFTKQISEVKKSLYKIMKAKKYLQCRCLFCRHVQSFVDTRECPKVGSERKMVNCELPCLKLR